MDVLTLGHSESITLDDTHWEADLADPAHCARLKTLKSFPDVVVHLAGRVHIALQPDPAGGRAPVPGPQVLTEIYAANVLATAHLIDLCRHHRVRHLIFASSQTIYGFPKVDRLSEDQPCRPIEHYALSKYCAEQMLERATYSGLAATALRIPGVYGEARAQGLVYRLCNDALTKGRIEVRSEIALPLDVIHVEDVVSAMLAATKRRPERWCVLNIATGESCSLDILADDVARLVPGCNVVKGGVPQPQIALDCTRARDWLRWQARPRSERLMQMLEALRNAARGAHA